MSDLPRPDGMKGVHWMPPSKEAADVVFDSLEDEVRDLKHRIDDMDDRHRSTEDALRIRIDEYRSQYLEWRAIATDLYVGCVCQVAAVEADHSCRYRKAKDAVMFWWNRENQHRG